MFSMQFFIMHLIAIIAIVDAVTTGCINRYTPSSFCCSGDIEIDNSVVTIGYEAFSLCSSLKSVVIPDSVVTIGTYAFYYCSSLKNVVIPDSVVTIGYRVFFGCSSLTNVVIGNSVVTIGDNAFEDCSSLTNVVIPDSVETIGDNAFSGCSSLTNVVIPDSVVFIGASAFWSCSSLTNVVIPDSVVTIGSGTFYKCSSLTNVVIGNSVVTIGTYAFNGCSSLTNVVIPDSVVTIGDSAFEGCSSLTNVVIGNSVVTIGANAFYKCSSLTGGVVIPDSVETIGTNALAFFCNCNGVNCCPAGTYGAVGGWGGCSKCDLNKYNNNGASSCPYECSYPRQSNINCENYNDKNHGSLCGSCSVFSLGLSSNVVYIIMSILIIVFISCFGFIKDPITKKFSSILTFGLFIYTAIPSLDTLTDLLVILSSQFASTFLMIACVFFYFLPNFMLFRDLYVESYRVRFPIPIPDKFFLKV